MRRLGWKLAAPVSTAAKTITLRYPNSLVLAGAFDARRPLFSAVQRKIDGIMSALADGLYQPSKKQRLADLEEEKRLLSTRLSEAKGPSPVLVHPNLAEAYRRRVAELWSLLDAPELREQAMEAIRSMIERIVVTPRDGGGVSLEFHGALARILVVCSENAKTPSRGETGFSLVLVAGARNYRYQHALEVAI